LLSKIRIVFITVFVLLLKGELVIAFLAADDLDTIGAFSADHLHQIVNVSVGRANQAHFSKCFVNVDWDAS